MHAFTIHVLCFPIQFVKTEETFEHYVCTLPSLGVLESQHAVKTYTIPPAIITAAPATVHQKAPPLGVYVWNLAKMNLSKVTAALKPITPSDKKRVLVPHNQYICKSTKYVLVIMLFNTGS